MLKNRVKRTAANLEKIIFGHRKMTEKHLLNQRRWPVFPLSQATDRKVEKKNS